MQATAESAGQTEALTADFNDLHRLSREVVFPALELRQDWLHKLMCLIQENSQLLQEAVSQDFGHRSTVETRLAELFPALEAIRHAHKHLPRWIRAEGRDVSFWFWPSNNSVMPQPLGVVGIIVPWNYPLYLTFGPLVAALAAGNRVMIKISELTPSTGALLERLLTRYLGADVVRVVNGDTEVAQAFTRLPFDHLLFTGSTAVGRQVMRAAADNLTPVTLELGGKSPVLVSSGAQLERAAAAIVTGKMLNAGQTCVAPDYLLVQEKDAYALLNAIRRAAAKSYPTLADNPDYTAIINERHHQRLLACLEEAKAAGASVEQINPANETLAGSRKFPLTLVQNCPDSCQLMQEEIFGPILPVITYDKFEDALAYIQARPRPLALYLFDDDPIRIQWALLATISGGVAVNETVLQVVQDDLPFGGVGPSGMGHYHAQEGFLTFSKLKPVYRQNKWAATWLTRPPYGAKIEFLLKWMLRGKVRK
ncbi:coniferyl aldehyde dehydrogenase [Neisseriaceae bacterium TC5R-5]|nr:coniferyl aldehyde dehydrogenase [Neisseriaceae bacterium TC5R-5]